MYTDYIYYLKNPENNEIFYVGKTQYPHTRLTTHTVLGVECDKEDSYKFYYSGKMAETMRRIRKKYRYPIMFIIEKIDVHYNDYHRSFKRELEWIKFYSDLGCPLLNIRGVEKKKRMEEKV